MALKAILMIFSILALLSCTTCHRSNPLDTIQTIVSPDLQFPIKSFTQIISGVEIKCLEKKDKKDTRECKSGWHRWTGSGSVIANDDTGSLVLTAGHVCVNNPPEDLAEIANSEIMVLDYAQNVYKASIIHSVHKGAEDFCLLHVSSMFLPAIPLSEEGPIAGDRVYNMSAPGGRYHQPYPLLLEGLFSGNIYNGTSSLISIPSIGGVSGSPVMNSNMEIVGIIYATNLQFRFETLATSYNSTLFFLNRALEIYLKKTK